jgi:hypothetical protein
MSGEILEPLGGEVELSAPHQGQTEDRRDSSGPDVSGAHGWTFLTNHSHVLLCIIRDPEVRLSVIAREVGVGERSIHRIVHDLIEAGYVSMTKSGRRNVYTVDLDHPLRHPLEADHMLTEIFKPLS